MSMRKSFTLIVKIAFGSLIVGATLMVIMGTTSFLPVRLIPIALALMFGGAGCISLFWKPRKIPEDKEVMIYTCAKCKKKLTHSEVYVIEGKNIPENHRCKECYKIETGPKNEPTEGSK